MAFFDWNHDGKKNYVDNAIEMMILDDIEEETAREQARRGNTSEWGAAYSGRQAYSKGYSASNKAAAEGGEAMFAIIKIFVAIAAIGVVLANIIGLFSGYVSWIGLVIGIVALVWVVRSFKNIKAKRKK